MKLIIQIPCFNEEESLPETLKDLPARIEGIDVIETLVIDDGSSDETPEVAKRFGATHLVRHARNRGLAKAFQTGIDTCLELGADIIVNTDADHQYPGAFIPALVTPILSDSADMVIADRQMKKREHLPFAHRMLQRLGSAVVRRISGTGVPDAPSGFRALSRDAAMRLEVLTDYTYTLETILQAGKKGLRVEFVPIDINPATRKSRLKKSEHQYVLRSAATLLRLYALFQPLKTFFLLGLPFMLVGAGLWLRYLAFKIFLKESLGAHLQSIVVGGALILIAVLLWSLGILGDILEKQRSLSERVLYLSKRSLFDSRRRDDTGKGK